MRADKMRCVWCWKIGCTNPRCAVQYHNAMFVWTKQKRETRSCQPVSISSTGTVRRSVRDMVVPSGMESYRSKVEMPDGGYVYAQSQEAADAKVTQAETTGVACADLGRSFIGIEIEP